MSDLKTYYVQASSPAWGDEAFVVPIEAESEEAAIKDLRQSYAAEFDISDIRFEVIDPNVLKSN